MDEFRNTFGFNIFKRKYAAHPTETWAQRSHVIVEDVCGQLRPHESPLMCREDRRQLEEYIRTFKFIPGGRYIYYAGKARRYWNNCLSTDTRFITRHGERSFDDFNEGDEVEVLSPVTGEFLKANVHFYGEQRLNKIVLSYGRSGRGKKWEVLATTDHRWPLMDGTVTQDLRVGDKIRPGSYAFDDGDEDFIAGYRHGIVFADGHVKKRVRVSPFSFSLRLCGKKASFLPYFEEDSISYPPFANGEPVVYGHCRFDFSKVPPCFMSLNYIAGFIHGWLNTDGHQGTANLIHCIDESAINFLEKNAWIAGIVITGNRRCVLAHSNYGARQPLYILNYRYISDFTGFTVKSIEYSHTARVACLVEPLYHQFTLAHGIATGNCFLFRLMDDTREEWCSLIYRVMSALMTGGGIGVDYSVARRRGSRLNSTGGEASGPVELMKLANEVGRHVRQGGSRRSALYGSLNWRHGDIDEFLHVKDWHSHPILPGYTLLDAKEFNADALAPLDMTNISINYDDEFLRELERGFPDVFVENVRQAMLTGEPGFSFNFGKKVLETLRNACTEVSSEDNCDMCNLGSINLANIDSTEELADVSSLSAKFLICGTIRGELPGDEFYAVREKNRRIGLGLMGVHEWLLRRGYRYEMTQELANWCSMWRAASQAGANEWCDRFFLSRPKAYRAIAPTGTIGILAGTTTGIEPIFACAYKRRFVAGGNTWKHQYVIDSTANEIIERFGIDESKIETSFDLANDIERRIKFQYEMQTYVDHGISSTINLPAFDESKVEGVCRIIARYCRGLRGLTFYPDGARGSGQPLEAVSIADAREKGDTVYEDNDACKGGVCGV